MSAWGLVLLAAAPTGLAPGQHRLDAPLPPAPAPLGRRDDARPTARRELGTSTTIFVDFDGVELGSCQPSDSHRNCHWYNNDKAFPPFSGTLQTKVSVLQAMRRDVADFGIRVTGQRPPSDEPYTMVVYGGTEAEYDALGSAPPGDCLDQLPNEIAFAHLDGELNGWVNGGATTALHEAAHSWGLDHIDAEHSIMFPSGDNDPTAFRGECDGVVADVELTPGPASCPELNEEFCGEPNAQHARAILTRLFGEPYVDITPPTVELVEPRDGEYFQAPASFDVVLDVRDDLHPQVYDATFWLGDDPKPAAKPFIADHFSVSELPIGTWEFHVELVDEAGHAARLDFEIEVGEDPPPTPRYDDGCAVGAARPRGVRPALGLVGLLLGLVARRRRAR